jgi:hypothetical protein
MTASPASQEHWKARIIDLNQSKIDRLVEGTPRMSVAAVNFVTKLVKAERERLIDAIV